MTDGSGPSNGGKGVVMSGLGVSVTTVGAIGWLGDAAGEQAINKNMNIGMIAFFIKSLLRVIIPAAPIQINLCSFITRTIKRFRKIKYGREIYPVRILLHNIGSLYIQQSKRVGDSLFRSCYQA